MKERHFVTEVFKIADLRPHPANYAIHPPEELEQLRASIELHGVYKNIVVAKDRRTILAGHGLVQTLTTMKRKTVPGYVVPWAFNHPNALKILAGDNLIGLLSERDDRAVSVLLKQIADETGSLLGTGLDEMMLANLIFVTRPASEIATMDAAAQWVGMPEYEEGEKYVRLIVMFHTEKDREEFMRKTKLKFVERGPGTKTTAWWPSWEVADRKSVRFES